jgi:hypothetical protein
MKKIMYFGLIISFIIVAGCGKSVKDKVTGTWKLKSVEGQTLSKEELASATITFNSDGKLAATAGTEKMEGTWELAKDDKSLTIAMKGSADKQVWNIQSITDNEFVYTQENEKNKITLMK